MCREVASNSQQKNLFEENPYDDSFGTLTNMSKPISSIQKYLSFQDNRLNNDSPPLPVIVSEVTSTLLSALNSYTLSSQPFLSKYELLALLIARLASYVSK